MRVAPECFPCLLRQTINTAKSAGADETQLVSVLREALAYMAQADIATSPARFSEAVYAMVARITGVADPYAETKKGTNALALKLLSEAREHVTHAQDPLIKALQVAAAGNVIDAGISHLKAMHFGKLAISLQGTRCPPKMG